MISYASLTGNTKLIAQGIKSALSKNHCVYCGEVEGSVNHKADVIFVGFWVDKNTCSNEVKCYLESLENQKVALFGTAGFGGSKSYFESVLERVQLYIPKSNEVLGSFMCQGKMPESVLNRYSKLLEEQPGNLKVLNKIDNYKNAASHPDKNDVDHAQAFATKMMLAVSAKIDL